MAHRKLNLLLSVEATLEQGTILTLQYQHTQQTFQRRFNIAFRLIWRRESNQRWNNVVYVSVEIYNVEQRWFDVRFDDFSVDLNNVRQRLNNVVVFNIDFQNVGQ